MRDRHWRDHHRPQRLRIVPHRWHLALVERDKLGKVVRQPEAAHRHIAKHQVTRAHLAVLPGQQAVDDGVGLLRDVGISSPENRLNDYPHQLSVGIPQLIDNAMALACDPELVIADEPTSQLDTESARAVMDAVATRLEQGR
mgnify:CR=1 FL=1